MATGRGERYKLENVALFTFPENFPRDECLCLDMHLRVHSPTFQSVPANSVSSGTFQAVFEGDCGHYRRLGRSQSGKNGGGSGGSSPRTDARAHVPPLRAGFCDGPESSVHNAEGAGVHEGAPRAQSVLRTRQVSQ